MQPFLYKDAVVKIMECFNFPKPYKSLNHSLYFVMVFLILKIDWPFNVLKGRH